MYIGDVKSKTFIDTNAASATFVAAAAQPDLVFTLAKTSFGTNTARQINATTSGTGDNGKTVTIVGTDQDGAALTEVITLTGSAETGTATTGAFLTITSATMSAQPAANVSLGMTADVFGSIFAGRTRVRQVNAESGGAIGSVLFRDGSITGTSLLTVRTGGTAGDVNTVNIPSDGILYKSGAFVTFSEANCNSATVYFDG
tara:strand:- start:134 stop:736 length:603 start_codon:yes stop_codon:yes gene_type:complete